jgi:hypothetical protein
MAITFVGEVQKWNYTDSSATETFTVTTTISAGNFAVVIWHQENDATNILTSVTDSAGNTWAVTASSANGGYCCGIAYGIIATALTSGSGTITLHWTNTSFQFKQGTVLQFSGVATSTPLDANSTVNDTFGSSVSIPLTTTTANTVVVAVVAQQHSQTYTVGGSFTDASNQSTGSPQRDDYCYSIVSATGTYDPAGSLGAADNYRGSIASFKDAGGGGGATVKQLAALGVG